MADDMQLKGLVIDALDGLADPKTEKPLLDSHLVERVEVERGDATVIIVQDDRSPKERWALEDLIYDAVDAIDGIGEVSVEAVTKEGVTPKSRMMPPPSAGPRGGAPPGPSPQAQPQASGVPAREDLEGVGVVIAVASGKGGVGKSTVAVNLALALQRLGYVTGLLDVDIYGPSLPTLLGFEDRPRVKDRRIVPLEKYDLKVMSLGFLMDEDTPVIWRGPIVTGIIRQFLRDVDWRGTQYLIIDLPPGTGDAQLTLAQSAPIDGAVVVTTPSDLALLDAARGLQMFKTLNVDVLGIVENMSHFVCDECGKKHHIFGEGGGQREAKRLGTDFLGEIPLDAEIRAGGDQGKPIMVLNDQAPAAKAFLELATKIAEQRPAEGKKKKGLFSFLRA